MLINFFKSKTVVLFIVGWTIFFGLFWSRAIYKNPQGDLIAGHVNIWGDWAMHATLTSHMAYQSLIPKMNPLLWGTKLNYPFLTDLISAGLVKIGVPFWSALTIPSFISSVLVVIALLAFYQVVFRSKKISLVATSIFLFNGGFGFLYYLQDVIQSTQPLVTAINPPHLATNLEPEFIRWISVIDSMIIPQRAFALGFPLALIGLAMVYHYYLDHAQRPPLAVTLIIAILFGVLPLAHTHALLAVAIIVTSWAVGSIVNTYIHNRRLATTIKIITHWAGLAAGISIIALPLIMIFFDFSQLSQHFMKWFPGWYSHEYKQLNWLWFWVINWGVTPILAALGLITYLRNNHAKERIKILVTFIPFLIIFVLLNLFLFQPFIWDNTKLLVWVSVGWSGLAAYWLTQQWQRASQNHLARRLLLQSALSFVIMLTVLSGFIDAYRVLRVNLNSFQMYSSEELQLAEWAKQYSPAESVWLIGDAHNHWLSNLTGRRILLSYRGWMWTHGYRYHLVEKDMKAMFEDPQHNQQLLDKYNISYVVVGPNERRVWKANPDAFAGLFKTILKTEHYLILQRK